MESTCCKSGSEVEVPVTIRLSTIKVDGMKPGKIESGNARSDLCHILFHKPH